MPKRRAAIRLRSRNKPGSMPGQITPSVSAPPPTIRAIAFGPEQWTRIDDASLDAVADLRARFPVVWIDVEQFGDATVIENIGSLFGLHRLALEDAIDTNQRPKVEAYDDHLFAVARMLIGDTVQTEQIAFFLGEGYLITFQEVPGDCFEPVRERIRLAKGRIRTGAADYLFYALLDSIVDFYFPALERYGEALEQLEDDVVRDPHPDHVAQLHDMKRDLLLLRRAVWPHREMISELLRDEHPQIQNDTTPFLRDAYDHTVQLMDIVETYREIASGLLDVYMSSVSVKLNEVMKVLTIVATIFMPLSFIASLYGMNFDRASPWNMPELGLRYGYLYALGLMLASAAGILWYTWRKGWMFVGTKPRRLPRQSRAETRRDNS